MTKPDGPLAGVRLIEMDAIGPVPLAGMLLSGLGCEIVRVARPGQGAWSDVGASILHRGRSEEHTSELQSLMRISYAVFCLKKKKKTHTECSVFYIHLKHSIYINTYISACR